MRRPAGRHMCRPGSRHMCRDQTEFSLHRTRGKPRLSRPRNTHAVSVESEALDRHEELQTSASLFGAEQLSAEEAARLLADERSRLVVFVGDRGAGKTSLCVELYERQRAHPSGVRFAGSWTLLALEQLAHLRRVGRGSLPPTPEAGDHHILHLALEAGETPRHLLLGDLSGEIFRRLANNQLSAADVPLLARADKLVLLVDGEQLVDVGARSSALTWVRQLVERLRSQRLPKP